MRQRHLRTQPAGEGAGEWVSRDHCEDYESGWRPIGWTGGVVEETPIPGFSRLESQASTLVFGAWAPIGEQVVPMSLARRGWRIHADLDLGTSVSVVGLWALSGSLGSWDWLEGCKTCQAARPARQRQPDRHGTHGLPQCLIHDHRATRAIHWHVLALLASTQPRGGSMVGPVTLVWNQWRRETGAVERGGGPPSAQSFPVCVRHVVCAAYPASLSYQDSPGALGA